MIKTVRAAVGRHQRIAQGARERKGVLVSSTDSPEQADVAFRALDKALKTLGLHEEFSVVIAKAHGWGWGVWLFRLDGQPVSTITPLVAAAALTARHAVRTRQ